MFKPGPKTTLTPSQSASSPSVFPSSSMSSSSQEQAVVTAVGKQVALTD